jgi:hypothetical protein
MSTGPPLGPAKEPAVSVDAMLLRLAEESK